LTNAGIDAKAFQDLKKIDELHLEDNMLTSPLGGILPSSKTLSILGLTNNMLTLFENTWHRKWPKLASLQLGYNDLGLDENLHSKLFEFSNREQEITISLAENKITNFPLLHLPEPQNNQIVIDLQGNKLKCDCQTLDLWKLIKFSNQSIRIEGEVRCLNLNNELLADVDSSTLSCPFPCGQLSPKLLNQDCACQYFPAPRETKVNCSRKAGSTANSSWLASINQTRVIRFYQNHLNMTTLANIFDERTKDLIKLFDVSHNNISSFSYSQLPPKLNSLFLNNNNMKTLDISPELKNIPHLKLGGNPFACDCRSVSLIQFLQHFGSRVGDKDEINFDCATLKPFKTNVTFDKRSVCPDQLPFYLGLSLVMAIMLVLVLVYLTSKKEKLQFCFFSLPWIRRLYPEDWSLPYDVFISFSHHQEDFAEELRHHLESEIYPGYRCCIHTRDWSVGEMIPDQIVTSVLQSRRTLIVLSPEYVACQWTRMEFDQSASRAKKNPRHRLIMVLPREMEAADHEGWREDLDQELLLHLNSNNALCANDPDFWQKLRTALPSLNHSE